MKAPASSNGDDQVDVYVKNRRTRYPNRAWVSGELLTKQSFREQCDINFIVKQHASTGLWAHLNPIAATYEDASGAVDLQQSIQAVRDAEAQFYSLPAAVRQAAQNSPVQFLEMLADQEAYDHLVSVGLPTEPIRAAGSPPPAAAPSPSKAAPAAPEAQPEPPSEPKASA